MSDNVSVTFLRRQGVGGNTYNAGESAGFSGDVAQKLIRLGVAKPHGAATPDARLSKVSEPVRKTLRGNGE